METSVAKAERVLPAKIIIDKMVEVEKAIGRLPGATFGDDCCKLVHKFGDGLYIREMTAPKNQLNVSKLHKTTHPFFIMRGKVSIYTGKEVIELEAPHYGITKAGTKRVVFFPEETVWVTVHANPDNGTDLIKIEKELIAESYDDLPENTKEVLCHS